MPNMWTKMNTIQLSINVRKVPEDGEILMLSNYRPDYWKNQPKLVTKIITAQDVEDADGDLQVMFKRLIRNAHAFINLINLVLYKVISSLRFFQ